MRKLFFALTALAALSLLAPSSGFAQANNQVGMYLDPADLNTTSITTGMAAVLMHVVISYPYLEESAYGMAGPVPQISGLEFRLGFPLGETVFGFTPNGDFIDIHSDPDVVIGGYGTPLPVVDNQCYMGNFTVMTTGGDNLGYTLLPVEVNPSIPGEMIFAAKMSETVEELQPMYPTSGASEAPVFVINGTPIAAESETWGGVKSLYR